MSDEEQPMPEDARLLHDALDAVTGERRKSYGDPERNFALIAELWGSYLGHMRTAGHQGRAMTIPDLESTFARLTAEYLALERAGKWVAAFQRLEQAQACFREWRNQTRRERA